VQKYCALSNHCWSGYRGVANRRVLASLPTDLLGIVNDNFDEAAVKQRADLLAMIARCRPSFRPRASSSTSPIRCSSTPRW
jgi:TRAP-type C4-dicarboxylate transport system substrate-binding protein